MFRACSNWSGGARPRRTGPSSNTTRYSRQVTVSAAGLFWLLTIDQNLPSSLSSLPTILAQSGSWRMWLWLPLSAGKGWGSGFWTICWCRPETQTVEHCFLRFASPTSLRGLSTKSLASQKLAVVSPIMSIPWKTPSSTGCLFPKPILIMRLHHSLGIEPVLWLCYLEPIIPVWRSAGC